MATIIYNDRINTFKRMEEIDAVLESEPTEHLVRELATLRIQNLDCFRELGSLNNTGNFLYIHPLIKHFSLRSELEQTLKKNPQEFLDRYSRAKENVGRYACFIKSDKRSDKQKVNDKKSLQKWSEECDVYKQVLEKK